MIKYSTSILSRPYFMSKEMSKIVKRSSSSGNSSQIFVVSDSNLPSQKIYLLVCQIDKCIKIVIETLSIFLLLNSNLGPVNPFGNSEPMLHNFWKLSNPGIYVILKSRSQLLPGKVAQISGFYCGWKMFLAKVLCRCKLVPCCVEPGGVTHNDVFGHKVLSFQNSTRTLRGTFYQMDHIW